MNYDKSNIFAKILYHRLQGRLEQHQSPEQCDFRLAIRIEDALGIVEIIISGNAEFDDPLWITSLDLKKAFDRLEHCVI